MKQENANGRTERNDIESEADVRNAVDTFYGGIDADPIIGHYFADLEMDYHLPSMYAFWTSIVFQTGTYRGRPFDAHVRLDGLTSDHFATWLQRFDETLDSLFAGVRAERMKEKARQIGTIFQIKLGLEIEGQ